MDFSVIVPVYKGEKTIEKLFNGISENLKNFGSFEVLFVFDSGIDNSWEILKKLLKKYQGQIRIFKLKKNYGQHNAILYGISESKGNLIITMDEDLQHDPRHLVPLIEKQKEMGFDVVYGRFLDPKHPLYRKLASKILQRYLKIAIPGLGYYSSFRVLKKEVANKITLLRNSYTFIDASLIKVVPKIGYLDIDHRENTTRKSTYSFIKLASHAIQIALAYTKIARWILIASIITLILGLLSIQTNFIGQNGLVWIIGTSLGLLLIGIFGVVIHNFEITSNTLPVISIENE
jgi:polyisoprenyl-phosphate glycosyltransferase